MGKIRIVTDSTADIPDDLVDRYDITVIPLTVYLADGREEIDRVSIKNQDFFEYLKTAETLPTTSQIPPHIFMETYEKLAEEGAEAIISIHISEQLSGTVNNAKLAAEDAPIPVHVVDSKQATIGQGLIVLELAKSLENGMALDDALALGHDMAEKMRVIFLLDTLDNLEKGGRIGKAGYLIGSFLSIKPILMLHDGVISVYDKVRTKKTERAIKYLAKVVHENFDIENCPVIATAWNDRFDYLEALDEALALKKEVLSCELGSVVSTHIGLGAVGVAFYQP